MLKKKLKLFLSHLIVFLIIAIIFILYLSKSDKLLNAMIFIGIGYAGMIVFAGIPTFIRKILKKETFFSVSVLFGLISFIELLISAYLFFEIKFFKLNPNTLSIIYLLKVITVLAAVPVHACIYNKVGFFYLKLLKNIIEKTFKVKILKEGEYKIVTPDKVKPVLKTGKEQKQKRENKIIKKISKILFPAANFIKGNKKKLILSSIALVILIIIFFAGIFGFKIYKKKYFATIVSITPEGETTERTVIKIIYSADVEFKNPSNPGDVLKITPKISGTYKIEGRTLIFIPDRDLPLSAKYEASIDPSLLKAVKKRGVQGKKFSFNTKLMAVDNISFFYNIDEATKKPVELIGEIEFTLPVDFETLKERIELKLQGKNLVYDSLEPSEKANTVYFKLKGIEQSEIDRYIDVILKKGIMPLGGTLPIEEELKKSVLLKQKDKLQVEELETHPVVGNTYISIKFNMPVVEAEVKKYISIKPDIAYKISAEYRYMVLEADFEPNITYEIKINKSLKAKDDSIMAEDYSSKITIQDMSPYVKFASQGKILPMTDNLNIEFVTLNLDEINFSVEKIYKNNLINYLMNNYGYEYNNDGYTDEYGDESGEEYGDGYDDGYSGGSQGAKFMHSKKLTIEGGEINEEVKNLINLKTLLDSKYQGLYNLKISDSKEYYNYTSMTVNVTNMGMIIKNDGKNLLVYVVNILNLNPMANINVSLISLENQILQEGFTDNEGKVIFYNYKLTQEKLQPYLIFAEKKEDFTFLVIDRNQLDYSTFDVSGVSYNSKLHEAYASTERGVYRPGEDVFTSLIIRKASLENPDTIPLRLITTDPTGTEVYNKVININNSGIESVTIPTQYQFKTGEYYINVYQDDRNIIGSTNFKVEEFIPYNIEVRIDLVEQKDDKIIFKVKSNELHGAPSKGLKVNCNVIFKSMRFFNEKYPDYNFYNQDADDFYQITSNLGESALDDNGEKTYELEIPASLQPPSAIRVIIYVEVFDSTGRPVSGALSCDMHKYSTYFGVKADGEQPYSINKKLNIKYVAIDPKGKEIDEDNVKLRIERQVWYSIFKKFSWTKKYSSETYNEILFNKEINLKGHGEYSFIPDKGGYYTITISKKDGMTTKTKVHVYDSEMKDYRDLDEPYKLIMNLDKDKYNIGDKAYLTIIAPFEGMALLTLEREKVYKTQFINLSGGKAVVPINVTNDFIPNMYVSVIAYRKPSYEQVSLPPVSYGAVNITLDKSKIAQDIKISCPEKTKSSDGLKVDLALPGGAGTKVIIACVDEGILQITNFQRPDPYDFFFRKRGLTIRTNSTLKDLLPDIAPYKKAFGGDYEGDLDRRHLNPIEAKRVKSLSLYSGILEADASGRISHTFKMHQFNGKVRVMVMSAKNEKFGSTQAHVTVTDPIVVVPGIPRIMAPQDIAKVPVNVFNKTGAKGSFKVTIKTDGPLQVEGKNEIILSINNDGEEKALFTIKGKEDAGVAHITINAEGNGQSTFTETELAVRPAAPLETRIAQGTIQKGGEIKIASDEKYIREGSYKNLVVSSNKMIRCIGALEYLVQYPYGCTEQVVSTAFPLLYLKELSGKLSIFNKNTILIDKYINLAVKKVEKRVSNNGEFAFWEGGTYYTDWISDYASHFIIEAKRSGYPVSDELYNRISERIGLKEIKIKRGRLDRRDDNIDMEENRSPYRLYLKALIGVPDFDNMKYYYDMLLDKKKVKNLTETDRCFMAAAYALANDKEKADEFLPENFVIKTLIRKHGGYFDSYVRNTALYLFTLELIDPQSKKINFLEEELFKNITKDGHFGNTQDTAWALIALSRAKDIREEEINAQIFADGSLLDQINGEKVFASNQLNGKEYSIKNLGADKIYYSYVSFGYPLFPDKNKVTQGLNVNKEYFDTEGNPVDIKNVKQGDQLVITLTVKNETKEELENIILLDLLPAGLEIENLRLASRGDFANIPANNIDIDYEDIRDDRIIISARKINGDMKFSYLVRAVSPGEYIIPQFKAEAMYDPGKNGKSGSKENLIVKEGE